MRERNAFRGVSSKLRGSVTPGECVESACRFADENPYDRLFPSWRRRCRVSHPRDSSSNTLAEVARHVPGYKGSHKYRPMPFGRAGLLTSRDGGGGGQPPPSFSRWKRAIKPDWSIRRWGREVAFGEIIQTCNTTRSPMKITKRIITPVWFGTALGSWHCRPRFFRNMFRRNKTRNSSVFSRRLQLG